MYRHYIMYIYCIYYICIRHYTRYDTIRSHTTSPIEAKCLTVISVKVEAAPILLRATFFTSQMKCCRLLQRITPFWLTQWQHNLICPAGVVWLIRSEEDSLDIRT